MRNKWKNYCRSMSGSSHSMHFFGGRLSVHLCLPEGKNIFPQVTMTILKGPHSPKMHCSSRSANLNFIWHKTFKKLPRSVIIVFFHYNRILHISIRLCKYVPCLSFYSFPVLFCICSVYIYKISRLKLTSTRRVGSLFEQLECIQPMRSRV